MGEKLFDDLENIERNLRYCPLLRDHCKLSECMFYSSSGTCAIVSIAVSLHVLREGVPIIQLFKSKKQEMGS